MSELAVYNEEVETFRPSAAIDPQRLEYLWTLAERMAKSTIVPDTLKMTGPKANRKDLPPEVVVANVFAVVEQADRWNISPFALLACSAIVHGRLGFEGKVISAVLKSRYGVDLEYEWSGEGENRTIRISGRKPGSDKTLVVEGVVKDWKTSGDGSPWRPATYDKMLAYRGAREFARLHEPSAILGVLGDDEILAIGMERQAQQARDITPSLADRFGGSRSEGFQSDNIKALPQGGQVPMETVGDKPKAESEVQRETTVKTTSSANAASAKPASDDAGAGGSASTESGRPQANSGEGGQGKILTATEFKKYASSLARMGSPESLKKADDKFWAEHGGLPAKGTPAYELALKIFMKQKERAAGKIEAEGLLDELNEAIDEVLGEAL